MNRLGVYRTYIPTYYIIASGYTSYSYILYIFRIIYSYLFSIGIELSHIRSQLKKKYQYLHAENVISFITIVPDAKKFMSEHPVYCICLCLYLKTHRTFQFCVLVLTQTFNL